MPGDVTPDAAGQVEREVDGRWEAVGPTAGLWVPSAEMLATTPSPA